MAPPLHYPFSMLWTVGLCMLLFAVAMGVLRGAPRGSVLLFYAAIGLCFAAQALDGFWWLV